MPDAYLMYFSGRENPRHSQLMDLDVRINLMRLRSFVLYNNQFKLALSKREDSSNLLSEHNALRNPSPRTTQPTTNRIQDPKRPKDIPPS